MTAGTRSLALLVCAGILLLLCLARPTLPWTREVFRYLFVLDITRSMNARDYHDRKLPADRLSVGKLAIRRAIRDLPCGSEASIGLFSTQDVVLLIEPLEICAHFAAIDDLLEHIDWRMAWAADSNVERGLYGAMRAAADLRGGPHLVFLSDGEQNIRELHRPPLAKHKGKIQGFLFGVGGRLPSPIPKLDENNRVIGFWSREEVDDFSIGSENPETLRDPAPEAPYSSSLHEANLKTLAAISGLEYHRLETPQQFGEILQNHSLAAERSVKTDVRWIFAAFSILLILAACLFADGGSRRSCKPNADERGT